MSINDLLEPLLLIFWIFVRNRTAVRWQCKEVGALFDYNIKIIDTLSKKEMSKFVITKLNPTIISCDIKCYYYVVRITIQLHMKYILK